ncbi:MAG: SDR family NAD(P)-dependent oxidoreductase [Proteobacteria bacterium]|nr:SDR family NAD(P)-dependent oxidoreductase [Pseudomonadota bacterium]
MSSDGSPLTPACLVTGASSGIGAELARVFAAHGHRVVLTARDEAALNKVADSIAAAGKSRPHVIAADLGEADGVARLAQALAAAGLEPAYLVNNAGFGLVGDAASLDRADELRMIDLNNRVLTDLSLRFVDSVTRHQGGVLNVASIAAFLPGPGMAVYHATKAYVLSLSEALHEEFKEDGVRVCALCPGPSPATGFFARAGLPADYFPAALLRDAASIAQAGYDGFMGGHRVVVPGKPSRIMTLLPRLLPRALVRGFGGYRWRRKRRALM